MKILYKSDNALPVCLWYNKEVKGVSDYDTSNNGAGRRSDQRRVYFRRLRLPDGGKTELSHVVSVSAGACNGVDYVSKQIGRTRDCMIHKEKEYNYYYGFRKFVKEKSILDMDMVFDKYPNELFP